MLLKNNLVHQLILIVVLLLTCQSIFASSSRIALVIGNSNYKSAPLQNPVNDATDMAKKLEGLGFEVNTLLNADVRTMKKAISQFGRKLLNEHTVGLFYFAGHGVQVNGNNYLLPIGTQIESEADVEFEAVDAGRILSQMSLNDSGLNMVILDACRNNPFKRSFRSASRGLAKMQAPKGSLILYATSPGDVAADGTGRNGLFTEKLMSAMDKNGLKIEEVFKQTAIAVSQASDKQQVPYIEGVILGDFYFTDKVVIQTSPSEKSSSTQTIGVEIENRYWDSVVKSNNNKMYQAYLDKYPNGHYADLALIKLGQSSSPSLDNPTSKETEKQLQVDNTLAMVDKKTTTEKNHNVITDNLGIELVKIPSGCFQMGSPENQKSRESDENEHKVCITKPFYLGKYEITQGQWQAVMNTNPSAFKKGDNYPVDGLSTNKELNTFIKKVSELTGHTYRLPTEAEWEYACRSGGHHQTYCGGDDLQQFAWFNKSGSKSYQPVGQKQPNAWGLYDMSGNVREWVQDMYKDDYYQSSPMNDPINKDGANRVARGGSWNYDERFSRAADRFWVWPIFGIGTLGLRLVREID